MRLTLFGNHPLLAHSQCCLMLPLMGGYLCTSWCGAFDYNFCTEILKCIGQPYDVLNN